jgi:hypothetical protein
MENPHVPTSPHRRGTGARRRSDRAVLLGLAALAVAAVAAAWPGAVAAQYGGRPTIVTDQPTYPAGSAVAVTVTNCLPPGTSADLLLDGEVVGQVAIGTDASGEATVVIPPDTPEGEVAISVVCNGELVTTVVGVTAPAGPDPTPTPPPATGDPDPTLPFTGGSLSLLLARIGAGALGIGLLFVFLSRRRDRAGGWQAPARGTV